MKNIQNLENGIHINYNYPHNTGRFKKVTGTGEESEIRVAFLGDSTLENGYWVQRKTNYADKTDTVTHQTAIALARNSKNTHSYVIANYAIDGSTTSDLFRFCKLNRAGFTDDDHPDRSVKPLDEVKRYDPDYVVLSVGGNNYREALMDTLKTYMTYFQLFLRLTPTQAKTLIDKAFNDVKMQLLADYKAIIDRLLQDDNSSLQRIVLLSQYYPAITDFTPYFIYTGFSHVARSGNEGKTPFTLVEKTMNELYREILTYAASQNIEVVFVDVASSLNPLGGNHSYQIEPNEQGSKIIGKLIAEAIEYDNAPSNPEKGMLNAPIDWDLLLNLNEQVSQTKGNDDNTPSNPKMVMLRMNQDETIQTTVLDEDGIKQFEVKKIASFISENRYRHLGLFFSPASSLNSRFVHAYEVVMGKQFDTEYTGLFAFGLLDLSLVTILAAYLWRVAIDEQRHIVLRTAAAIIAAPILIAKLMIGLAVMLALALPIYTYHSALNYFKDAEESVMTEPFVPAHGMS